MNAKNGELALHQGVGFLISTLLGSGVFIVPAMVAAMSGPYFWLPWLGMTILMLPVLFVFSRLAKEHPHAAGAAHFVRLAFGDKLSKCVSMLYLSVIPVGPPVMIIAGANYLTYCFGLDARSVPYLAGVMLSVIVVINLFRISIAGNVQFAVTVLTAIGLGLVIYSAGIAHDLEVVIGAHAGFDGLNMVRSMGIAFWCFVGIEAVVHVAPEFRDPDRDFPRAVYLSVFATVLLYCMLSYSVWSYSAFGNEEKNIASLPNIIRGSFGNVGAHLIGVVGFATCLAAANVYVVSFTQLLMSLSEDGTVSAAFQKKSRNTASFVATVFVVAIMALTVVLKFAYGIGLERLIYRANGVFISIYLLTSLSSLALLPQRHRPVGVLSSAFCVVIAMCLRQDIAYAVLVMTIGLVVTSIRATGSARGVKAMGNETDASP